MTIARELRISGRVQGVGFRWTARRLAGKAGVTGWIRNDPGGGVTAAVQGAETDVREFLEQLREAFDGYIGGIEVREIPPEQFDGFTIRR